MSVPSAPTPSISPSLPPLPAVCLHRLATRIASGRRTLIGIVGAPGAGKSTFAEALRAAHPAAAQVVPMDGFHLANVELARLGRAHRKGAPDTFDAAGYLALLRRLRAQGPTETVYAPEFRREIEEPIAGAIAVLPQTPLLLAEGNYLLLDEEPWVEVAAALDEVWYLEVDDSLRRERLLARHRSFGRSAEAAAAWVTNTDEPNARRIAASAVRATLRVRWDG
jgi:pantothenate kinase